MRYSFLRLIAIYNVSLYWDYSVGASCTNPTTAIHDWGNFGSLHIQSNSGSYSLQLSEFFVENSVDSSCALHSSNCELKAGNPCN